MESVKAQYSQWRATHGKGHRIPPALWGAVKELTKCYAYQQISSELKISPSHLRKKCGPSLRNSSLPASPPFVQVPLSTLFASSPGVSRPEQKYPACAGIIELVRYPFGEVLLL